MWEKIMINWEELNYTAAFSTSLYRITLDNEQVSSSIFSIYLFLICVDSTQWPLNILGINNFKHIVKDTNVEKNTDK